MFLYPIIFYVVCLLVWFLLLCGSFVVGVLLIDERLFGSMY